ncbi:MAG: hypothetical protein KDI38_15850, partial [Calditrichaeota bacterium]|nr:hypothetical protein [Calditrichota bacterium]
MNAFRYIPALLVCILFFQPIVAQSGSEAGRLFIQNFSPKDYGGAHAQNWAVLQDQRGIMYFGNGVGVLEYDGVAWRLIPVSNQTIVRSLEVDENNRIYVGAVGDFGYLAPDSAGRLAFVSLLDKLPEANRDFSDVWQILHTREGIYFRTNNYLFRWELEHDGLRQTGADTDAPGTLRIWKAAVTFHHSFFVRDTLYIRQQDVGLMRMTGDSLQLLPGGELFADQDVRMLLPLGRPHSQFPPAGTGQAILVGTSSGQFFIFNGKIFHPFKIDPPAQQYLFANRLYHGAALPDHSLALATRRGGVVIIDREGKIQQIIDKTAGLRDQLVRFVYPDREGGLWLGLNNGLARVEYPAPFTFYNEASGITGFINSIVRFGDEVYAGGNAGIFRLLPAADHRTPAFQAVPGAGFRTWSLLALEEALLAAAANGIFRIEKNRVVKLADTDARSLYRSRYDRNLVFAGLNEGLAVLKQQGGQWRLAGQIAGISEEVRTIAEEGSGILWLGAMHQGFLRVIIPDFPALSGPRAPENLQNAGSGAKSGPELFATVQRYGPQQGLPTGTGRVFFVKGRVVFATDTGLKRFDPLKQQFLPDTSLGAVLADTSSAISHVVEGRQGGLWIKTTRDGRRETGRALPEPDGSYSWNSTAFERIADWGSVYAMYADPQHPGVLWLGGPEGIARYDHAVTKNYAVDFPALVRRVVTLKGDSLIYGGAAAPGMTSPPAPLQRGELENSPFEGGLRGMSTTLPYTHNALRFQFAASSFDDPTQNRYQVFLEGFDEDWSNWISETQKDYTNIPEGDYAFRVRAKN